MTIAYAVDISEANLGAIASEAGRKFDREHLRWWCDTYGMRGYFVRDEGSSLDCELFLPETFFTKYEFKYPNDSSTLFRPILKLGDIHE